MLGGAKKSSPIVNRIPRNKFPVSVAFRRLRFEQERSDCMVCESHTARSATETGNIFLGIDLVFSAACHVILYSKASDYRKYSVQSIQ